MNKQQIKDLLDQLSEDKVALLEKLLSNLLKHENNEPPKGNLGLKRNFDRDSLYDEILATRY